MDRMKTRLALAMILALALAAAHYLQALDHHGDMWGTDPFHHEIQPGGISSGRDNTGPWPGLPGMRHATGVDR